MTEGSVTAEGWVLSVPDLLPGVRELLVQLSTAGVALDVASATLGEAERAAEGALAQWYYVIGHLHARGALRYAVAEGTRSIAALTPISTYCGAPLETPATDGRYVLSRFAHVRREGSLLMLESPLSLWRVEILDPAVLAVLHALREASDAATLAGAVRGLSPSAVNGLVSLLLRAGMLEEVIEEGAADGTPASPLDHWEFADLLFHARSRMGRHAGPVGATYRLAQPVVPTVKPAMSEDLVELARPDMESLRRDEASFTSVFEDRRSVRRWDDDHPITVRELGEFLFRVARVRRSIPATGEPGSYDTTSRPYPSGGACYPLELYTIVRRCEGLDGGVLHYDPLHHRLERLPVPDGQSAALLEGAARALGWVATPQVLLVLGARFGRVNWKYQAMAYATVLKEVGVVFQSMYLVASAMRLGPCALGLGDAELFARGVGTGFVEETSVGEFALGRALGS